MSFQTEIYAIMITDPSVNSLANGGVKFDILPANFDLKKSWVVYNFIEKERVDVLLSKNVLTIYSLFVKVISPYTNTLLSISDELNRYLTNYTDSTFLDISFVTDNHQNNTIDDMDIFENTIEYSITYKI